MTDIELYHIGKCLTRATSTIFLTLTGVLYHIGKCLTRATQKARL